MAEKCRQQPTCDNDADYRYTWAGRDESFICEAHARWFRDTCEAMGYYCQLILLPKDAEREADGT